LVPPPAQFRAFCQHYPLVSSFTGSLSVLLDNLQGLSEAIFKEEAICQGDNQNSPAPARS
jgi:hypothetical protein